MSVETYGLECRARIHAALGEPHRLAIVDALRSSDRSPSELLRLTGLPSNLLAFHLAALEEVGLIERHRSSGDARRRYVSLCWDVLTSVEPSMSLTTDELLFVCTHNSARSQLAAALWRQVTGDPAMSAGTEPAGAVHPLAVEVAREHGLDLSGERPRGYADVRVPPTLVVSVCDRAREAGIPWEADHLHWSVTDPAGGDRAQFDQAYTDLDRRVMRLATATRGRPNATD